MWVADSHLCSAWVKSHNDSEVNWTEIQRSQGHSWGCTMDNAKIVIRGGNLALGLYFELFICNMNDNGLHIQKRRFLGLCLCFHFCGNQVEYSSFSFNEIVNLEF